MKSSYDPKLYKPMHNPEDDTRKLVNGIECTIFVLFAILLIVGSIIKNIPMIAVSAVMLFALFVVRCLFGDCTATNIKVTYGSKMRYDTIERLMPLTNQQVRESMSDYMAKNHLTMQETLEAWDLNPMEWNAISNRPNR